ncbi:phosphoglycolate phosphatase [Marinibactrum halimedae]|uniref:Phosphoglycolate phosphatase n=1 Tax=Marinibactrum halimedae TaxID=1444977 RepID=A0AA37T4K4_9GAMM|nr:phosphoglycolate phosphatase [Marinibactrum halimedae]MCD9459569.1 phosphoglycolate phosphatase [Marinibactrum halimedae]GLS25614.1 phosphoglycolate phosphatase [Marinibactrum halimedae]
MISAIEAHFSGLPKAVLFDLDGTLVDSAPGLASAVNAMLRELKRPEVDLSSVRQWIGNGQETLVRRALSGCHSGPELGQLTQSEVRKGLDLFRRHYQESAHECALFGGVRETLEHLQAQQVVMAIVTNKPVEFVPSILAPLQLTGFFTVVLGGECLPEKKPHPLPIHRCLEKLAVTPAQALMVGDSANDLIAAREAGVASLALTYGYHQGQDLQAFGPIWLGDSLADAFGSQYDSLGVSVT